jgi:hypothetical protein
MKIAAAFPAVVSLLFSTLLAPSPAKAITIILEEVRAGQVFPVGNSRRALSASDANTAYMWPSSGDYRRVVRAAADYWERIYTLPFVITISWGFAEGAALNAPLAQAWRFLIQSGTRADGLVTHGVIAINRSPPAGWYVDYDCETWSEYPGTRSDAIPYWQQPGKAVEHSRYTEYSSNVNASRVDLFTTVLHEMGHVLGLLTDTPRYDNEVSDGDIDVVPPRPAAKISWTSSGGHLTHPDSPFGLMAPGIQPGRRKWPSQADISCIAEVSDWWTTSWGDGGGGVTGVAAQNPTN